MAVCSERADHRTCHFEIITIVYLLNGPGQRAGVWHRAAGLELVSLAVESVETINNWLEHKYLVQKEVIFPFQFFFN